MLSISRDELTQHFRKSATNSSHVVWLLSKEILTFEASNGWVFGYKQFGGVTLFALEPLIPGAPSEFKTEHLAQFKEAWAEVTKALQIQISLFIGIYGPFSKFLHEFGFQTFKAGEEPWVNIGDCIPQGNAGKGVRSARNHAIKAGLYVEEWSPEELANSLEKRQEILTIFEEWKSNHPIALDGFLNFCDPLTPIEGRRTFVILRAGRAIAYLIASPVPGINSYFLEDLITRNHAPKGTGELITLEALVALQDTPAFSASLGVVGLSTHSREDSHNLPHAIHVLTQKVPKLLRRLYNFSGLEIYRKRFKPHRWETIHLALHNNSQDSDSLAWIKALVAMLRAFNPILRIRVKWIIQSFMGPIRKTPITLFATTLCLASFGGINHFGVIPPDILARFGFSGDAPLLHWPLRSFISDFLFFDPWHFVFSALPYIFLVAWVEKSHRRNFAISLVLGVSIFDDILNQLGLITPLRYFRPLLFNDLVAFKDVGCSLGVATLLGVQLCQFRRVREPLFAMLSIGLLLGLVFSSAKLHHLVMNLNHLLFLSMGFLIGKLDFSYQRHLSRKVARGKPPVARSVRPPKQ